MTGFEKDDTVITEGAITREQIEAARRLVESICGLPQMTCLKHGQACEMRRSSCVISTRKEAR